MSKTSEANAIGMGGRTRADGQPDRQHPGRPPDNRDGAIGEAEHLKQDFARVRARGVTDPALATGSLAAAWTTDVMEEDEAEFVDAVADCLGAGFSLESALMGWDMGTLAADGVEEASLFDDAGALDDEPALPASALAHRRTPPGSRRVFVT